MVPQWKIELALFWYWYEFYHAGVSSITLLICCTLRDMYLHTTPSTENQKKSNPRQQRWWHEHYVTTVCKNDYLRQSAKLLFAIPVLSICAGLILYFCKSLWPLIDDQKQTLLGVTVTIPNALVCHHNQRTKISGARKDWPDPKLGVLGQILVVFAKK